MSDYTIDTKREIDNIVSWIKKYFVENGPQSKAIIGMSGGKDSTIAAKLLCNALGSDRILGVIMPNGEMKDRKLAEDICKEFGMPYRIADIKNSVDALYKSIGYGCEQNDTVTTNTPSRIRMATLYAIAAVYGGRVVNTCNKSEDYIGFSTKYGDLAGDFSLFKNYPVRWVLQIGDYLDINMEWVHKIPDDGMCGQSDEEKFGFTYETLDEFLINGKIPDYDTYLKIMQMHERNKHKEAINLPAPEVVSAENCEFW